MTLFRPATVLMVQYAHYHRDRRNIATHLVGIPLIVLAVGVLLQGPAWVVADQTVTLAWAMWALTSLWYLSRGDVLLGVATTGVNAVLIALAHEVPPVAQALGLAVWQAGLGLFVIGWVLQFIGHYFEGRKPFRGRPGGPAGRAHVRRGRGADGRGFAAAHAQGHRASGRRSPLMLRRWP